MSIEAVIAAALQRDSASLDVASANIVNSNTPGFKAMSLYWNDVLSADNSVVENVATTHTNTTSGKSVTADNALDVYLAPGLYLTVDTPNGPRYTRDGRLTVSANGTLTHISGYALEASSGDLRFNPETSSIAADGSILDKEKTVAKLNIVSIAAPDVDPTYGSQQLFSARSTQAPNGKGPLLTSGAWEASNVDMTAETIRVLELSRHFDAAQRVMRQFDTLTDQTIDKLSRNT